MHRSVLTPTDFQLFDFSKGLAEKLEGLRSIELVDSKLVRTFSKDF